MSTQQNTKILARGRRADLCEAARDVQAGELSPAQALERNLEAANAPGCANAYVRRFDESAKACAKAADLVHAGGAPLPALAGLAISVKDLFDVAGQPTTAGSAAMHDAPAALADCPAVARLRSAGAVLTGHTNLSEFAFSGVGINPHFGTPRNSATIALDPVVRVPGGSTSGGATTVAAGAAWAALGSDTGGSIRIPAALQGLVGFKNTQKLTPTRGAVPLSTTLDTACAITLSVRDAVLLHEVLAARQSLLQRKPWKSRRFVVPQGLMMTALDNTVARAFERTLSALRSAGAQVDEQPLPQVEALVGLHTKGSFAAAESWAWHRERLATREAQYDPRVAMRIKMGAHMTAADYIDLVHARQRWMAEVELALAGYDAALSPTVPMVAPALEPLLNDDAAFFDANRLLLRNTSVVNFLDGCALSMPCQAEGELPVGLMVWGSQGQDDTVLSVSLEIEELLTA